MKITICRKAHFNAAHKLYNQNLSNEENFEIFGKCSYENFHGHNYELIVKILGDINPKTGMVMDLSDLKKIIKTEVEDLLDHKNLNLDIPHFKDTIPTTENLAIFIWNKLNSAIKLDCELSIVLYETPRNYVEYSG
ncbi:MAG: 6-carboxytetrahydropterin synthase [Cryomorphaceae bacterium]|nr:MAG: 6-carboxytetrahydropterin synthase [Cryomorphaceae bacterium]|tara:strand:+ start:1172 stop:1579 length:408 start_codon:yes stop_codon:yes gene_type:complete